jgi:hypothetical protein
MTSWIGPDTRVVIGDALVAAASIAWAIGAGAGIIVAQAGATIPRTIGVGAAVAIGAPCIVLRSGLSGHDTNRATGDNCGAHDAVHERPPI